MGEEEEDYANRGEKAGASNFPLLGPYPFDVSSVVLSIGSPHPPQLLIWAHLFQKRTF